VPAFYIDSSALVKLVKDEPESSALLSFVADARVVSCDLILTEVPRAIRQAVADDPTWPLERLLARADERLGAVALLPLEADLLLAAGALAEPRLRTLDAIHVAAALASWPLDGFISYDERQAAAARLAGIRTIAPGA
jgi:uncharacterized protein